LVNTHIWINQPVVFFGNWPKTTYTLGSFEYGHVESIWRRIMGEGFGGHEAGRPSTWRC
jgi:hypothetical protein